MVSIPIYPQCGEIKVLCRTYEKLHEYGSCDGSRRAPHVAAWAGSHQGKFREERLLHPITPIHQALTRLVRHDAVWAYHSIERDTEKGETVRTNKIEPPKLGEEASCIIELIISSSPENGNVISVSPILVGVEYRKKVNQSIGREIGVNVSGRSLQDRI